MIATIFFKLSPDFCDMKNLLNSINICLIAKMDKNAELTTFHFFTSYLHTELMYAMHCI